MYLVLIAWLYVALMMAVAEATASNGTLLGAAMTFLLYGLLPMSLVLYLLGTPARRRAIKRREAAESQARKEAKKADGSALAPDAGGHPARAAEPDRVAAVREEP